MGRMVMVGMAAVDMIGTNEVGTIVTGAITVVEVVDATGAEHA